MSDKLRKRGIIALVLIITAVYLSACSKPVELKAETSAVPVVESADSVDVIEQEKLLALLQAAERIPNTTAWFEIIALPNDVYALWEPGHFEKVNSFYIIGASKDILYDSGMGIGSMRQAVDELRAHLGRSDQPLMLINSHNHLDHNAGNFEFDEAWIIENEWAIRKLTQGVPGGFAEYWAGLTPHPGITTPEDFDPTTFVTQPFPREGIRFLADGDVIDLGNRQFRVVHTKAHSPDGLALYDESAKIFFGGDTFLGDHFLIGDMQQLANDLARVSQFSIAWHYSSHGSQLIEVMRSGWRLSIVKRLIAGEGVQTTTEFAGAEFPLYELDGVAVTLATDFLTY